MYINLRSAHGGNSTNIVYIGEKHQEVPNPFMPSRLRKAYFTTSENLLPCTVCSIGEKCFYHLYGWFGSWVRVATINPRFHQPRSNPLRTFRGGVIFF